MAVVVEAKPGSPVPGGYGWYGGFGTVWANDPKADLTAIALTQSVNFLFAGGLGDFWTAVYRAIAA
jgi:CubicO group peptidase (beta-lactamase class C family)